MEIYEQKMKNYLPTYSIANDRSQSNFYSTTNKTGNYTCHRKAYQNNTIAHIARCQNFHRNINIIQAAIANAN